MVEVPIKMYMANLLKQLRSVVRPLAALSGPTKDRALTALADALEDQSEEFLAANREDVLAVGKSLEGEKDKDRVKSAVARVRIEPENVAELAAQLRSIVHLPNPVGELVDQQERPNGLLVTHMRVPHGLIGVLSELNPVRSLPILAMCFKAGNVTIFRGVPEWTNTHRFIATLIRSALESVDAPAGAITLVERPEKDAALEIMRASRHLVDALIVRGGPGLRKTAIETSRLPILCHDGGICHGYIDAEADLAMAQNLIVNAKAQKPDEPTSVDTVLVHNSIARQFLPAIVRRMLDEFQVDVYGCPKTVAMIAPQPLPGYRNLMPAQDEHWSAQFFGPTLAVRMVDSMEEALSHIGQFGQGHTAFMCTRDYGRALRFTREVDASAVLINASPRLHAGDAFGLGSDVGLSSARVAVRGPIGLEALTSLKYVAYGTGQLRHPHPTPVTYEDAIMLKMF
ncbi:gamma-glutamyl phosphate reductase [Nitrospira sp.]|nr:gamma-glutamyl phosphate reductase [Nitrospira sp.]